MELDLPGVRVEPIVSDYVTNPIKLDRFFGITMALYVGSSIGNFEPLDARKILRNLRNQLHSADTLLLGTDLVKPEHVSIPAYDDAQGVTAEFNRNVLRRLNAYEILLAAVPQVFGENSRKAMDSKGSRSIIVQRRSFQFKETLQAVLHPLPSAARFPGL